MNRRGKTFVDPVPFGTHPISCVHPSADAVPASWIRFLPHQSLRLHFQLSPRHAVQAVWHKLKAFSTKTNCCFAVLCWILMPLFAWRGAGNLGIMSSFLPNGIQSLRTGVHIYCAPALHSLVLSFCLDCCYH